MLDNANDYKFQLNDRYTFLEEKKNILRGTRNLSFLIISSPEPLGSQGELIGWP